MIESLIGIRGWVGEPEVEDHVVTIRNAAADVAYLALHPGEVTWNLCC